MQRMMVTGGSGFIGKSVIRSATQHGYRVSNLDIVPPLPTDASAEYAAINILDRERLREQMHDFAPTHVIHLAGETDFTLTNSEDFKTVINGSLNVFQIASELPRPPKLVHVSTQYVLKPGIKFQDQRSLLPYTAYGTAKARSEELLWGSNLTDWVIVRPCIVYGPHFTPFADGLLKYVANGRYMYPSSRTPIIKTWGYVRNVADQMVRLAEVASGTLERRVYYLGDMVEEYSVWIDSFSQALNGAPARRVPASILLGLGMVGEVASQVGFKFPFDMGRYHRTVTSSPYSIEETLALTGPPAIEFGVAVSETVAWLREHWARSA